MVQHGAFLRHRSSGMRCFSVFWHRCLFLFLLNPVQTALKQQLNNSLLNIWQCLTAVRKKKPNYMNSVA